MIDFRYHLVSLIAVFLAVALGIIIGTTALNEPLQANIEGQVTELEQDKRALEDRTQQLQAQLDTSDAFGEAVAPALVDGALADSSVLLILGNEDVLPEQVEQVTALITEAGGTVSGTISLAAGVQRPRPPPRACRTTSPAPACPRRASSCPRPTTRASWSAASSRRC